MTAWMILALSVLAAAGGARYWWSRLRRRRAEVIPGVLRSGVLPPRQLARFVERAGLATVIDLRRGSREVDAERAQLAALGVRHVHLPSGQLLEPDTVERFLEVMREAPRPVLIHCKHGAGRTPTAATLHLVVNEGWDLARAQRRCFWPSLRMFAGYRPWRRGGPRALLAARAGQAPPSTLRVRRARVRLSWHKRALTLGLLGLAAFLALSNRYPPPTGGLLLLASATVWSVICAGYARRTARDAPTGPYRWVRHPEYVSTLLFTAAALWLLPVGLALEAGLAALVALGALAGLRRDDRKLRRRLRDAAPPGDPQPAREPGSGGFSWARAHAAGAWPPTLALAVAFGAPLLRLCFGAEAGKGAVLRIALVALGVVLSLAVATVLWLAGRRALERRQLAHVAPARGRAG